jgi:hypothetical protein
MAIVLAFLLGMPLIAVPQISAQLQGLLLAAQRELRPLESVANTRPSTPQPDETADVSVLAERGTTGTTLASDRSQPPFFQPNPDGSAATIEELKAQLVEAGVSYMVLERIGTDSARYKFRFDVPVAAGSAYRKRFQVVDDAPDEAMRRALAELQRWRVAGREPAHLERPTVILR